MAHAVRYELISSSRWRLCADTPSFCVANNQHAMNHAVSGVRVLSKMVPAVADVAERHVVQRYRLSPSAQPPGWPQVGHTNPYGQRSHSR